MPTYSRQPSKDPILNSVFRHFYVFDLYIFTKIQIWVFASCINAYLFASMKLTLQKLAVHSVTVIK